MYLRTGEIYEFEMIKATGVTAQVLRIIHATSMVCEPEQADLSARLFSQDYLMVIDESHVTVPQIRALCLAAMLPATEFVDMASDCHWPKDISPVKV